jgi:2',3'-cyclic-nucleotide 2'-phosphodiesterase (5'-nucleotidase family)
MSSLTAGAGVANLAAAIAAERAARTRTLFLFGGDSLGPSLVGSFDNGRHVIEFLNVMRPDAMALGSHELAYGSDILVQRLAEAQFPVLNTTLVRQGERTPIGGTEVAHLVTLGAVKVGLFSVMEQEALSRFLVKGLNVLPPGPAIVQAVSNLKKSGVDVIVAATGANANVLDLLRQNEAVDIIFSADAESNQIEIDGRKLIARQGGSRYLVAVDVNFEKASDGLSSYKTFGPRLVALAEFEPDPALLHRMTLVDNKLSKLLEGRIGQFTIPFQTTREAVRTRENPFGNFVADTLLQTLDADVAIINGGSIRGERSYTAATPVTWRDIKKELPFNNRPVLLEVTGRQLIQAIENGVSRVDEVDGRFAQISNMVVSYGPDRPVGGRIVELKIGGAPVDPERTYRLATTEYLADGGDGYEILKGSKWLSPSSRDEPLWRIVGRKIKKLGDVALKSDGRILPVFGTVQSVTSERPLGLSEDELAWIRSHPKIRVANEDDWPPFDFSVKGEAQGISIDYLNAIAGKLGLQVDYINGLSWADLQQMARDKKLDVLTSIVETPERLEFLHFTDPYVGNPSVLITHRDTRGIGQGPQAGQVRRHEIADGLAVTGPGGIQKSAVHAFSLAHAELPRIDAGPA